METNHKNNNGESWSQGLGTETLAVDKIDVKVELTTSDLFNDLGEVYFHEVHRITRFENKVTILSQESLMKFCKTILHLHVLNIKGSLPHDYSSFRDRGAIPAFLYSILLKIGPVYDKEFGIYFEPYSSIDDNDLLTSKELSEISNELLRIENLGLKLVTKGLPNRKLEGNLDTMAAHSMANEVRSYRHGSPVGGFFMAFFNTKGLEQHLDLKSLRVRYGYHSTYRYLLEAFVHESEGS